MAGFFPSLFMQVDVDKQKSSLVTCGEQCLSKISFYIEQFESRAERYCYMVGAFIASTVAKGRIS
jgi:hypothetical protein